MKKTLAVLLSAAMAAMGFGPALAASPQAQPGRNYSYVDLVSMLTDAQRLALLPDDGEKTLEASSYSRASKYDEATGQYVGWADNGDNYGVISEVNDERGHGVLVMDAQGPGAIVRSWSAQPESGAIDLYLDGQLYSFSSFQEFLTAQGPFAGLDGLCYKTAAQGYNNYVPISFNESCKIILRDGWGAYYQFHYVLFGEGCTVETMPRQFSAEQKAALQMANDFFKNRLGENPTDSSTRTEQNHVIFGGSSTVVYEAEGQGALSEFRVRLSDSDTLTDQQIWDRAQELSVSMYWDGETTPSVFAPLGDFFGTPTGHAASMLTLGRAEDGWFYCYFFMPYADGARIVIENDGLYAANLTVSTATAPLSQPIERYTRFHAKWERNHGEDMRSDRYPDCTVLETEGAGRFVGMSLHVYEKGDYGWWGEGDEKFFVDGEDFPSWFGTGTEDYFGYAWGDRTEFSQAYHAQPFVEDPNAFRGHITNTRVHLADSIPFFTSFEGALEQYLSANMAEYATTAYWYLSVGGTDPYGKLSYEQRTDFYKKVTNLRLEAEALPNAVQGGKATVQAPVLGTETLPFGGDKYLLYDADNAGDSLTLTMDLPSPFEGNLLFVTGKLPSGGRYDITLDGESIRSLDFYNPILCSGGQLDFGRFSLSEGEHKLVFTARQDGDEASTGRSLALDSLVFDSGRDPSPCVLEGEELAVKSLSNGVLDTQLMSGWNQPGNEYSGNAQLWWRDFTDPATGAVLPPDALGPGETLELYFDVQEDFSGTLQLYMTRAGDYGIVDVSVDDVPLGTFDGCGAGVVRTCGLAASDIHLAKGRHVLKVEIVGKSGVHYLFGLDCLVLTPQKEAEVSEDNLVVEAESMTVLDAGGAQGCDVQPIPFTHGTGQLFWHGVQEPGEELKLSFVLPQPYRGDFQVGVCMAADYGKFQFLLDGNEIGGPVDTYQPALMRADYLSLGQVELSAGEHVLTVKNVGKNDLSAGYLLGLDTIRIYHGQPQSGCIEGEDLTVNFIGGAGAFQTKTWKGHRLMVFDGGEENSYIKFYLGLGKDIDELNFTFAKGQGYGTARLFVDETLIDTIDFYSPAGAIQTYSYSGLNLKAGDHFLRLELAGKNADSTGVQIGLDQITYPCALQSLQMEKQPDTTTYLQGQPLDLSGMRLTGVYEDGVTTPIAIENIEAEGYDPEKLGEQTVTLSAGGLTAALAVQVNAPEKTGIKVVGLPLKLTYELGEEFDSYGLVVKQTYSNGREETVTGYTVTGYQPEKTGVQNLTVTYDGQTASFAVEVVGTVISPGDVDGDGEVNAHDALKVLQHSVKLVELDAAALEAADVTHDGRADAYDALKILQYSVLLITAFE